ncbi:MAG: thermonuclease family protein [Myxococcota bacterium]|nr:thermonuclease family protein [Myxococcota bacterium]
MWLMLLACSSRDKVPIFTEGGCDGCAASRYTTVESVIDGDTVQFSGDEETTRLLGVDTPEVYTDGAPADCYGLDASDFTKRRLPAGLVVELQYDVDTTDVVGRNLAYVVYWPDMEDEDLDDIEDMDAGELEDAFGDPVMLNIELLERGYARIPDDDDYISGLRYEESLRAAEQRAIESGAGLWGECEEQG